MKVRFIPVPEKPTPDMIAAALPTVRSITGLSDHGSTVLINTVHGLMIETTPPPPGGRLTDVQHNTLVAICDLEDELGHMPSHLQIAERMNKARSSVTKTMSSLIKKHYIRPAKGGTRIDGQGYSEKRGYVVAIKPEAFR